MSVVEREAHFACREQFFIEVDMKALNYPKIAYALVGAGGELYQTMCALSQIVMGLALPALLLGNGLGMVSDGPPCLFRDWR